MKFNLQKKSICILFLLVFMFFFSTSYGQDITVSIYLSPAVSEAQVIYLSDFDFAQLGGAELLYQLQIFNNTGIEVAGRLRLTVIYNGELIAEATTSSFALPTGYTTVNNIQIADGWELPNGASIIFDESEVIDPPESLFQGGKLPRGNYDFRITFITNASVNVIPDSKALDVINPSYINLVSPGIVSGAGKPEIIYTEFPLFQFDSDLSDPHELLEAPFHVQVFKKLNQHETYDEALTSTPYLDEWTTESFFNYQQFASAQPLDPGIYVWRVQMRFLTTNGTEDITSPIFAFEVKNPGNLQEDANALAIRQLLQQLLGNRADQIASNLNNFTLKEIRVNDTPKTIEELYKLIDSYEGYTIEISDLILQSSK